MTGPLTDALAWAVVALFGVGVLLDASGRRGRARTATFGAWVAFAGFWLALVPHFALTKNSLVEGLLSLVAVPACLYTGYKLYQGRDTLLILSKAVAVMGLVYLPAATIEPIRQPLVEHTTRQVEAVMYALSYDPQMVEGKRLGYRNAFRFETDGGLYQTEVVLACTGIGSMSIFAGLVAAVDAPAPRKLAGLAVAIPVIYVLNVARVTFIALAHGKQWFAGQTWVLPLLGASNPEKVSYLVADRIISQSLSVVALVAIALVMVRVLPELVVVFEDVLYLVTGDEYDLRGAVGVDARPDGGAVDGNTPGRGEDD